jgi:hypothetical protein
MIVSTTLQTYILKDAKVETPNWLQTTELANQSHVQTDAAFKG